MIEQTISFGILITLLNLVSICFILDIARRVIIKIQFIRHPHLFWFNGMVFLFYLLVALLGFSFELYTGLVGYVLKNGGVEMETVVIRVVKTMLFTLGKGILWYYNLHNGFNLFKNEQ